MTEKPMKKLKSSSFLGGIVFFFLVIFLIIWGYNTLLSWAQSKNDSPINAVVVHGEFRYLKREELEQKIVQKLDGSFFSLDVVRLQNKIEENPWVYSASIRKEWPRKLHIYVVEQDAFAIWNNDLLLNKFGDVFYANDVKVDDTLARLYGPEGNEKDVLKGYVDMEYLLKLHNFKISELVLSERYAWQVWLKSGIHLNLGRSDKMSRVQRFLDLQPLLVEYGNKKIARVDLRYDIGLAVSWQ
ncbi:cell division protein FtsQ [Psychrosphaera saromensis]|jgi:cell division protein FtsQ|uniref:Cell division protein FtsQ n=2 Tax=Psychrosphaera saromensis TaxID=716813 RepID=A0A2S7UW23_9GAMM|nr:cell division protein FtsQ/DivIB [Psychrosphaera saromensis]PQJ53471.1 hypothetical protein BTO11_07195 [Psychrosphaera saromensis]GHB65225.1 cell division protein FtsQ [Psychrosphaera saromensis]GLQ14735.1 cell division protein FtsQ [Psychrosphaera saromensis]